MTIANWFTPPSPKKNSNSFNAYINERTRGFITYFFKFQIYALDFAWLWRLINTLTNILSLPGVHERALLSCLNYQWYFIYRWPHSETINVLILNLPVIGKHVPRVHQSLRCLAYIITSKKKYPRYELKHWIACFILICSYIFWWWWWWWWWWRQQYWRQLWRHCLLFFNSYYLNHEAWVAVI